MLRNALSDLVTVGSRADEIEPGCSARTERPIDGRRSELPVVVGQIVFVQHGVAGPESRTDPVNCRFSIRDERHRDRRGPRPFDERPSIGPPDDDEVGCDLTRTFG